jgi:hypothetical protein
MLFSEGSVIEPVVVEPDSGAALTYVAPPAFPLAADAPPPALSGEAEGPDDSGFDVEEQPAIKSATTGMSVNLRPSVFIQEPRSF